MATIFRQLLKYLLFFGAIWMVFTQMNSYLGWASLYIPAYWIFVYFPGYRTNWWVGLIVTFVAALFFETQYASLRGVMLPTMLLIFLALQFRRMKVVDTGTGTLVSIASIVHWLTILAPGLCMRLFHSDQIASHYWVKLVVDGVAGQVLLFFLFPVITAALMVIEGREVVEDGSISVS